MGRDRSRSPRRKERRRSRSRERERRPDESGEKRLDKFGRDVTSRPERYGGSRGIRDDMSRDQSSSSKRRDDPKEYRRDDRYQQPPPPPQHSNQDQEDDFGRYDDNSDSRQGDSFDYYDSERRKLKESFEAQEENIDDETKKMQQIMGIGGFDTTKNKKVSNNVGGYAKVNKTQKYRQYMNRRGGFNRPLDWVQ